MHGALFSVVVILARTFPLLGDALSCLVAREHKSCCYGCRQVNPIRLSSSLCADGVHQSCFVVASLARPNLSARPPDADPLPVMHNQQSKWSALRVCRNNASRSDARRVGKECVSTCRSRWCPYH